MLLTNLLHHFYVHKVLTFIPDSFKYIIHDEIQIFLLLLVVLQNPEALASKPNLALLSNIFKPKFCYLNKRCIKNVKHLKCFDSLSIKIPFGTELINSHSDNY